MRVRRVDSRTKSIEKLEVPAMQETRDCVENGTDGIQVKIAKGK